MTLTNEVPNGAGMEPSYRPQRSAHKDDTDDTDDGDEPVSGSTYDGLALCLSGCRRDPHIPDTHVN